MHAACPPSLRMMPSWLIMTHHGSSWLMYHVCMHYAACPPSLRMTPSSHSWRLAREPRCPLWGFPAPWATIKWRAAWHGSAHPWCVSGMGLHVLDACRAHSPPYEPECAPSCLPHCSNSPVILLHVCRPVVCRLYVLYDELFL